MTKRYRILKALTKSSYVYNTLTILFIAILLSPIYLNGEEAGPWLILGLLYYTVILPASFISSIVILIYYLRKKPNTITPISKPFSAISILISTIIFTFTVIMIAGPALLEVASEKLASITGKASICRFSTDNCYFDVAVKNLDPSTCLFISSSSMSAECLVKVAAFSDNTDLCNDLPENSRSDRSSCIDSVAVNQNKQEYCNLIENKSEFTKCLENVNKYGEEFNNRLNK